MALALSQPGYGGNCDCEGAFSVPPENNPSVLRGLQAVEWLTDEGEDLDVMLHNNLPPPPDWELRCAAEPDGSIDFVITVDQALNVSFVFLILRAWDVDLTNTCPATGCPEVNKVYINGHYLGTLTGANNSFSINTFTVPVRHVNAPGENAIKVEIDTCDAAQQTGCHCAGIDWGLIAVAAASSEGVAIGNDCRDYGYDADGDGLFDTLNFDIPVIAASDGAVTMNASLYGEAGNRIGYASTQKNLSGGQPDTMTLSFDGEEINCQGEDGPYTLREVQAFATNTTAQPAFRYRLYTSSYYSFSQFETCTTASRYTTPSLPPMQYLMVSVPLYPDDPDPLTVFGSAFGDTYDRTVWRLLWRDPIAGTAKEYPDVPQVAPGVVYWLASRDGPSLDITGTVVTDETFSIPVPPGWVQIGNPYYGTVQKDDLKVTLPETGTSVSLSDSSSPVKDELWGSANGSFFKTNKLKRWRGYFIFNESEDTVSLIVPNPFLANTANAPQSGTGVSPDSRHLGVTATLDIPVSDLSIRKIQDDLPLPPTIPGGSGGIILGMITDADTSLAVTDASVYVDPLGEYPSFDGKYLIASIPSGSYAVNGFKEGYLFASQAGVVVANGESTTEDFSLKPIAPINITKIEVTCNNPEQVTSPRLVEVFTDSSSTVYYHFWARSGYGTGEYETTNWDLLEAYSTDNMYTWNPTSEGHYVVMVWVTDSPSNHAPQMGGLTVPVGISSDVRIVKMESSVTQGITASEPITLTTTTSGSTSGSPYYTSYVRSGYATPAEVQSAWDTIGSGYANDNEVEWTPSTGGSYIVMTHAMDDLSSQDSPEMAGMTCTIGE
jgi:hypothetical protein